MLGELISAGASLVGGIMGNNSQKQQAKANAKMQKEFAQHGIRWKVADAKAAGIHPLAALGAQTVSFTPQAIGSDLSTGIANAGQDIGRAINSTRTQGERVDAYTKSMQLMSLQRAGLENELLKSQLIRANAPGTPPPMPDSRNNYLIPGQTGSGLVQTKALERSSYAPGNPSQEAGAVTDTGYTRTPTGYPPVMSKDARDRLEDDLIGMIAWNVRNRILPTVGSNLNPPARTLAPGEFWVYDPFAQEYRVSRKRPKYGFSQYYR